MGEYRVYPPAELSGKKCEVQEVQPAEGYVLLPSIDPADRALLVVRIEGKHAGSALFEEVEVVYEQDGEMFSEILGLEIPVEVVDRQSRVPIPEEQRKCLGVSEPLY
jgi:hypothetical protein